MTSVVAAEARLLVRRLSRNYPIDLLQLLPLLDTHAPVEIHSSDNLPEETGAVVYCRPGFVNIHILINANHSIERQRFALAHEIGHLYLGHRNFIGSTEFQTDYDENPLYRLEADEFATEILMPYDAVHQLAKNNPEPFTLICHVRKTFKVSLEAAVRRILDLEIYKGAVIHYNNTHVFFVYNSHDFNPEPQAFFAFLKREGFATYGKSFKRINHPSFFQPFDFYCQKYSTGKLLAACLTNRQPRLYESFAFHQRS